MSYDENELPINSEEEHLMPTYLDFLDKVVQDDVEALREAEESYGDSWKKRGGVGAFMMLARKFDRIENQINSPCMRVDGEKETVEVQAYDIFEYLARTGLVDGLLDDVQDLRRYLTLVEAEMRSR